MVSTGLTGLCLLNGFILQADLSGRYTIDLMVNAIDQCFNQPDFGTYAKMESLFRPVYKGNFCRSNSVQLDAIFVAPKLQPAAIS